jgi:hypothetical protein
MIGRQTNRGITMGAWTLLEPGPSAGAHDHYDKALRKGTGYFVHDGEVYRLDEVPAPDEEPNIHSFKPVTERRFFMRLTPVAILDGERRAMPVENGAAIDGNVWTMSTKIPSDFREQLENHVRFAAGSELLQQVHAELHQGT